MVVRWEEPTRPEDLALDRLYRVRGRVVRYLGVTPSGGLYVFRDEDADRIETYDEKWMREIMARGGVVDLAG